MQLYLGKDDIDGTGIAVFSERDGKLGHLCHSDQTVETARLLLELGGTDSMYEVVRKDPF